MFSRSAGISRAYLPDEFPVRWNTICNEEIGNCSSKYLNMIVESRPRFEDLVAKITSARTSVHRGYFWILFLNRIGIRMLMHVEIEIGLVREHFRADLTRENLAKYILKNINCMLVALEWISAHRFRRLAFAVKSKLLDGWKCLCASWARQDGDFPSMLSTMQHQE